MSTAFTIDQFPQGIFPDLPPYITLRRFSSKKAADAAKYLLDLDVSMLGLALQFSDEGSVKAIAFATERDVALLDVERLGVETPSSSDNSLRTILEGRQSLLAGFNMANLAIHVHRCLCLHVRGVDLSTEISRSTRAALSPSELFKNRLVANISSYKIDSLWDSNSRNDVCLCALISARLAACCPGISDATRVDTYFLDKEELACLGGIVLERHILRASRPVQNENDFSHVDITEDGAVIHNTRYKTRVRHSEKTTVYMETDNGEILSGKVFSVKGKRTEIVSSRGGFRGNVSKVRVVGKEELTCAEQALDEFILLVLCGQRLQRCRFISMVWFPHTGNMPELMGAHFSGLTLDLPEVEPSLNSSQAKVVHAILNSIDQLVIVYGPPGTGKTKVISVAVEHWDRCNSPVWVTAQSNVAVKNIAEALVKRKVDFKIIISKEFYVEWHEHIYEEIQQCLIRTDEIPTEPLDVERELGGSTVVLCTLSTLSNPVLEERRIYEFVPVGRLIVDEASQVNVSEFMHLFDKFAKLEKVCFFGDPKQLPPYGQDTAPSLKSIFDFKHLVKDAYFLNTQYRMPVSLGDFISRHMYNSKLLSGSQNMDTSLSL